MIEYFNEDCMVGMARYPDKYFDLAIVDPPYGIGFDGQVESVSTNRKKHDFKGWDSNIPTQEYFNELFRVSKNQIIWGGNYMVESLMNSRCWVIWDKMQEFSGSVFEMAWTSFDTPAKAFRMSRVEAYVNQDKIHPTQKPVALYKWLLKNYAKQGDLILDTHVGSASSLIACHDMGFDAVGFELDPDYYKASKQRLDDFMAQPRLTDVVIEQREQIQISGR